MRFHQHSIQRCSSVHAALTGTGDSGVIGDVTGDITDDRLEPENTSLDVASSNSACLALVN
jgi:hypothetical protein